MFSCLFLVFLGGVFKFFLFYLSIDMVLELGLLRVKRNALYLLD